MFRQPDTFFSNPSKGLYIDCVIYFICLLSRLPEVPEDTEATNPILKRFDSPGFLEFSRISQRHAYFGLGKALLEFETAVGECERKCEGKFVLFVSLIVVKK